MVTAQGDELGHALVPSSLGGGCTTAQFNIGLAHLLEGKLVVERGDGNIAAIHDVCP